MSADYFEAMFQGSDDPWDLETSDYEQAKYRRTVAALGGRRYAQGFEVGCAKGVVTRKLAPSCASLLSVDVSDTALAAARRRCEDLDHISFETMTFPGEAPTASFDLMLLSEVVYYWDDDDIARAGRWMAQHILGGGDMLLVHWTGETDYPQSGDEAVAKLHHGLDTAIDVIVTERHEGYRLDLWRRRG